MRPTRFERVTFVLREPRSIQIPHGRSDGDRAAARQQKVYMQAGGIDDGNRER